MDIKIRREPGFYWVKFYGEWTVAKYEVTDDWYELTYDRSLSEIQFEEIDERRIVRNDKE